MLRHIFLSTLIVLAVASTNSTESEKEPEDKAMHSKALNYFFLGWPLLASTGLVGSILGGFYYYYEIL